MVPTEVVIIFLAFVGGVAGAIIGQTVHWRLEARRFAREAARVTAAPYDWGSDL